MALQVVVPNTEPKCPRNDRLQEAPSAKNAQGLFPPEACIFVGNLSTKVPTETLTEDLKSVFTSFGACHVKIKQDKKKGLPGAFVQFERVEDANAALSSDESTILHGRMLRIERAKGRRTACLGLRSLQPVTAQDVQTALEGRGSLEVYSIESQQTGYQTWTDVAKVTFAFVDDCRDAIKYFQKDDKYYLNLLDMDGSPLLQGPAQGPFRGPGQGFPRSKPYNGPSRAGNFQRHNPNNRQHRNGNGNFNNGSGNFNHRNGFRGGFPKVHHSPMNHHENVPPLLAYVPPTPIYADVRPPFFPPPPPFLPPPPPNGYYGHPPPGFNGFNGQLPFVRHPTPPDHFSPPISNGNGPFIVSGQPQWTPPGHGYFPGPNGFFPEGPCGPQPGMNGPPNGYFGPAGPMGNGAPWPGQGAFPPSPPYMNGQGFDQRQTSGPMRPRNMKPNDTPKEEIVDQSPGNDTVGGVPLNPQIPEKAPRLIRVYHSDDDENNEDLKSGFWGSEKSKKPVVSGNDNPVEESSKTRSPSNSITSTTSSRTCASPTQKPVEAKSHTKNRPSIEEYVRREALGRGLSEEDLQDVIRSLENEQMIKDEQQEKEALLVETDGCQPVTGTDSSGSQNGTVARNVSVKSV
ncbi:uncharacterized protein N7458_001705 [Penicillium daleae]|uniref:RRM domain-containing protein n=1 Tax=Penicillium daleae TaxID=63821 RepID=A0AAD6CBN0_9EURO|nr:uncharacterized protein N7458_001705 [Penicillium daleae]KAJ5460153.1 hypothetical protein N7458_001705 [Penicillium daleae]